jgi:hypothetical protein
MSDEPENWFDRALDSTPIRLTFFLWLVMIPLSAMFVAPRNGGMTLDWQFFQFFDEIARKTMLEHYQLPIWNPYFCGGTTLIGNPQTTYLVPTFPLVLRFGTTFGERLSNIPVLLLGCEGCWRLMRHLGVRRVASLLAVVAFPFYARTFHWIHDGQHGLPGWAFSMWVIYGYLKGLERPVYLALGGAFFGWMVCYRGIETAPELALGLGVWSLLDARRRWLDGKGWREVLWPLAACGLVGLFTLGFAGIRMVPVLELVLKYPRVIVETKMRTISQAFVEVYAIPPRTPGFDAPGYTYVGPLTFLCFTGAVLFARARKRAATPILVAVFFMLLTLGMHGDFSPLPWLHKAPLFKSLRNPYLWAFAGALFVVIAASIGLDEFDRYFRARGGRLKWIAYIAVPLVVAATTTDLLAQGWKENSRGAMPFTWQAPTVVPSEFKQSRGNHFVQATFPYLDRGTLNCYDETPFPTSPALRPDLPEEEYLADASAGTVKRIRWSPNKIELEATLSKPATVLINQNYQPGWSSSAGKVHAQDGLLAVDLPAGTTRFKVSMWPGTTTLGLLLMLIACAATWWLRKRDKARA